MDGTAAAQPTKRPANKRPYSSTESASASSSAHESSGSSSSAAAAAAAPPSYEAATAGRGDAADVRIGMWQRTTKRKLAGKMAPLKSDLAKFLAEHTDCEVYTGQDVVSPTTNGAVGRVAVWHKHKKQKLAGKDAPEAKSLLQWLNQHPDYEVFCGQLSKPRPGGKAAAAKPPAPVEKRVEIWNRKLGRRLAGNVAPYRRNLDQYLRKHPECELYTGQEATGDEPGSDSGGESEQDESESEESESAESSEDESDDDADLSPQQRRVTLWNAKTKKKVTGNNAPMAKNLNACLKRHPDYQVYTGQDGKKPRNTGLVRPKHGPGKAGPKPFARMGTFDFLGNDMLVVRTEDSDSPVPYYLGAVHKSHKSKPKKGFVPIQWIMPEFANTSRKNPRTSKKIATQWENGCSVLMRFDDGHWYHGVCSCCDGGKRTCNIDFDDGDRQTNVSYDDTDVVLISEHPFRQPMSLKDADDRSTWRTDGYRYKIKQGGKPDYVRTTDTAARLWVASRLRVLSLVSNRVA